MQWKYYIIFLLFAPFSFAQQPYAITYSIEEGLPSRTVYSILEAKNGELWFSTDVGVLKYNGYEFTHYTSKDGLADNEIFNLYQDSQRRIWFLSFNGKVSYYKNGHFFNSKNTSFLSKTNHDSYLANIYEDDSKNIYLVNRKLTVSKIDSLNNVSVNKYSNSAFNAVVRHKDSLYILTHESLLPLNPSNKNELNFEFKSNTINRTFLHNKTTYVSSKNRVIKITNELITCLRGNVPEKETIISLYVQKGGVIWAGTYKGVYVWNPNSIEKTTLHYPNFSISNIIKDQEGNIWLTTLQNGIIKIPYYNLVFNQFKNEKITCLATDNNNNLWIGKDNNKFSIISNNKIENYKLSKSSGRLDIISSIKHFINNETWVIGKSSSEKFHYKENNRSLNLWIDNLAKLDPDNYILASSAIYLLKKRELDSLVDFKKENSKIRSLTIEDVGKKLIEERATDFCKGFNNELWISSSKGLYKLDNSLTYLGSTNSKLKLPISDLLYDDTLNLLYIATSFNGLLVLKNNKIINQINSSNGLSDDNIRSITMDSQGDLWVGSTNGIDKIELNTYEFNVTNYNSVLGNKNLKVNDIAFYNKLIYVATDNGLIHFNKSTILETHSAPQLLINNVSVNNNSISKYSNLNLHFSENDIAFNYTGISYKDEGNLLYKYNLKGFDTIWKTTQNRNINYKALPSGNYQFQLKAVNTFGIESDRKTITFTIEKPYWKTWWFISICTIVSIGFIISLWKFRIHYLNKQFEKERKSFILEKENLSLENQMLELEQKALRLQMNPHFIFNALNTIKGYYSEGNTIQASDYISKFAKLLRLLLENVEQYISLALEVEMLELYLELTRVRYQEKFQYSIVVDKTINNHEISVPSLLLQPLIENAIIHGIAPKKGKGQLIVAFNIENNQLSCSVTDDGIGREASGLKKTTAHNSKALSIIKERLQLIESQENVPCKIDFFDLYENEKATGTKVVITIPQIKNY